MNDKTVVIGYGPVGRNVVGRLHARGSMVTVAQRTRPGDLPSGVGFLTCDVLQEDAVLAIVRDAAQVVLAIGLPYDGKLWQAMWPRIIGSVVEACAAARARLVFVDNLYMYGPQDRPLTEDMPLTERGRKPAARSAATRIWMEASRAGRVQVAAVRAPDFYGPGVTQSHLGEAAFKAMAAGKRAMLIVPPDIPHDIAYVPDFGRAIVTLLDAPDDAFGQAWHVPSAPTQTPREILSLGAATLGRPLRLTALPMPLVRLAGLGASFMRETAEMRFTWNRPYYVDASRFARRFWSDATLFAVGAAATVRSFQPGTPEA